MQLLSYLEEKVVPIVSLSKFDESWSETLSKSALFSIWFKIEIFCQKILAFLSPLGGVFELLSFALVVLLFLILPAPQFADDKNILALLVSGAFGLRVLAMLVSDKEAYKPCAADIAVIAFLAMNIIATGASHYLAPSIKGLSKMAVYFCAYFLFMAGLQKSNRKRSFIVIGALLFSATLVSLYGIYQYKIGVAPLATWEDPNVEDKTTRVYSTLKNPNLLAGYLIPLIPLSLSLAIMAFVQKTWVKFLSLPLLGVTGVIALCCVFTGCRGGYFGIAAGLGILAFIVLRSIWCAKPKSRPYIIVGAILTPVVLALALHQFPTYERRILSSFDASGHSSNAYRMNVYRSSVKMFLDSWWLGVGPGNSTFKLAYGLYMKSGFDALGTYCVPLEVAVETGVAGLLVFIGLIACTIARAHEGFWNNRQSIERWIAAGAVSALVAQMVHGLVDTVYYRPQVQFVFWLLLALCIRNGIDSKQEQKVQSANQNQAESPPIIQNQDPTA